MAGGGGGAWKVAYADFVTAMMALFLVLWILSQDEKIKGDVRGDARGTLEVSKKMLQTCRHFGIARSR